MILCDDCKIMLWSPRTAYKRQYCVVSVICGLFEDLKVSKWNTFYFLSTLFWVRNKSSIPLNMLNKHLLWIWRKTAMLYTYTDCLTLLCTEVGGSIKYSGSRPGE